jgi:hypothetical protein
VEKQIMQFRVHEKKNIVDPTAWENSMDDEHFCRHGLGELWFNNNIRHQGWETQLSKHIDDSMSQLTVSL